MPSLTSVAIIGLGSRGLSVLERLLTFAGQADPDSALRIEVIDPVADGVGVHDRRQPDYLLLNTICSQVSMFPDSHTVVDVSPVPGPSLYEWVIEQDLRVADDGFSVGSTGRPIRPTDFLPRRVLGEYLAWFFQRLLAQVPSQVILTVHRAEATSLITGTVGRLRIGLSNQEQLEVDSVFLTTGYTANAGHRPANRRRVAEPYPMPQRLAGIGAGQTAAIAGFGLSAMDAMSCLTIGRGGRYLEKDGQLRYLASGNEPRLIFYSRSGRPCRARPRLLEFGAPYRPLAFTTARIDALRAAHRGPLDFRLQVLPLIHTELRISYRRCESRIAGPASEQHLASRLMVAEAAGELPALLDRLDSERGTVDPQRLLAGGEIENEDADAYQHWLARAVADDLAEGELGLAGSVVKGALDILRELRDTFRYVVDFGGLTEQSLDDFMSTTVPLLNRAVVGPQFARNAELLALLATGVARTPLGPDPQVRWDGALSQWQLSSRTLRTGCHTSADWLVSGRVDLPAVAGSASPLLQNLLYIGKIRPNRAANSRLAGIDIDRDQHPIDSRGKSDSRIWVLGPLCEGATFYNNLVPSPRTFSRPIHDAHRCVAAVFATNRVLAGRR